MIRFLIDGHVSCAGLCVAQKNAGSSFCKLSLHFAPRVLLALNVRHPESDFRTTATYQASDLSQADTNCTPGKQIKKVFVGRSQNATSNSIRLTNIVQSSVAKNDETVTAYIK